MLYLFNATLRNCFKKKKQKFSLISFSAKLYRLKLVFEYSNWKQFQVFKIVKFEFKVKVRYCLRQKGTKLFYP